MKPCRQFQAWMEYCHSHATHVMAWKLDYVGRVPDFGWGCPSSRRPASDLTEQ